MDSEVRHGSTLRYAVKWRRRLSGDRPLRLFVFLHNRGANMLAFRGLADALDLDNYVYIFPNGPFPVDDAGGSDDTRFGWLDPCDSETCVASRGAEAEINLCRPGSHVRGMMATFLEEIS